MIGKVVQYLILHIFYSKVFLKSIGTKCDLEEELQSSSLVELPFTNLRACEKTSDKLPWSIELTGLQVYHTNNTNKYLILSDIDLNSVFSLKPKYHQYDNLLSSLSVIFNVDLSKRIDINLRYQDLDPLVGWLSLLEKTYVEFKQNIDYSEFDTNTSYGYKDNEEISDNYEWDDSKSFSTIR